VIGANNSARPTARFEPRRQRRSLAMASKANCRNRNEQLPYLVDRLLLPLAVALPRMLEKIEADLATARPTETRRLHQRAGLIRELLSPPGRSPTPP
jgi:hypothetical protein